MALTKLPPEQREAIVLVGASGMTYEEAASICGCAIGTIKSRVSRARDRLAAIIEDGTYGQDDVRPSSAMATIIAELDGLRQVA